MHQFCKCCHNSVLSRAVVNMRREKVHLFGGTGIGGIGGIDSGVESVCMNVYECVCAYKLATIAIRIWAVWKWIAMNIEMQCQLGLSADGVSCEQLEWVLEWASVALGWHELMVWPRSATLISQIGLRCNNSVWLCWQTIQNKFN